MLKNIIAGILIATSCLNLSAQKNKITDENILIGEWNFAKTVDNKGKEVESIIQDYKGPNGEDIELDASGPKIILKPDHTYIMTFTETHSDKGNWAIISDNEIKFEMVIPQDSKQGDRIRQTQKMLGKKWETNANGDYLDSSTLSIIALTNNEMKIKYNQSYIQIYIK